MSRFKLIVSLMILVSISLLGILSGWTISLFATSQAEPLPATSTMAQTQPMAKPSLEIDKNLPADLYPCLPKQEKKIQLRAATTHEQKKYYLVGLYGLPSTHQGVAVQPAYNETLVALDDIGCQVIVSKQKMGDASLTLYVPKTAAHNLMLQRYQKAIAEAGGKEKYQQLLLEEEQTSTPGDYSVYYPEDVWALNKLGIKLPKNIKVVNRAEESPQP